MARTLWALRGAVAIAGLMFVQPATAQKPARSHLEMRVVDAETSLPVRGADVKLAGGTEGSLTYTFATRFSGLSIASIPLPPPGAYQFRISAPGYVNQTVRLPVSGDETGPLEFRLERGITVPLEIVTAKGPAAGVRIYEGITTVPEQFGYTADAKGRFELHGKPREKRVLWIIPEEGSYAIETIIIPHADASPVRIRVPAPVGSIRARVVDSFGQPASAMMIVRANGEFLPQPALHRIAPGGVRAIAGEAYFGPLPAGVYELWASSGYEAMAIVESGGTLRPPVRVELKEGEQRVTVVAR